MKQDSTEKSIRRARNGAILLIVAVFVAALVTFVPSFRLPSVHGDEETVGEEPKVTYIAARPSVEPTPTPTVTSLKVSTFGTELTADGFTTYVGDRAVVLSATVEPFISHPPIVWSVSDTESASLVVSDDRTKCEFNALKPAGKKDLTVSCYGAEVTFPVFLWER